MITINGYFRSQSMTGQQRYASEIADRILQLDNGIAEFRPSSRLRSRYTQWLDLQLRLPRATRDGVLISLTARAPAFTGRQIVTIHDLFPLTNPEWFSRGYAALHRRLLAHHLQHAAVIAAVSEPVLREVRELAAPSIPVVLAPNAPTQLPTSALSAGPTPVPDRFFLAVGSLEPRKNLGRLVVAYASLPAAVRRDVPLLVVGGEASAFRGVRGLECPGVRFLGRVDDATLRVLYSRATAFVSVSLAEGFGIPVVEAAATMNGGLVLSDIPVYRWIAAEARPCFVDPHSEESIADGLLRVLSETPDVLSLRSVAASFSWDRSAAAILDAARQISDL